MCERTQFATRLYNSQKRCLRILERKSNVAPSPGVLQLYLPPTMWLAKPRSWPSAAAAMRRWQLRTPLGQPVGIYSAKKTISRNQFIKYNLKLIIFVFELSQVDELIERAPHRLQNLQCYHLSASEFTWKLIKQRFKAISRDLKNHKSNIFSNQRKMENSC